MVLLWIILSTCLISLISFIGVFTLSLKDKTLDKLVLYLVALSAGALMGGAFLHLIPEAVEKFGDSKWLSILGPWINGPDHTNVFNYLVNQINEGKRFTPKYGDMFNAFMHCEPGDVKVVIIGQDPYPQAGVADGIAFSCSKKGKAEASLRYIFSTLYQNIHSADPDLSRWSKQGVILLNTAFTTQVQAVGAHYEVWKPFTAYLLTEINKLSDKLAIVYMGRKAQQYEKYFPGQYNIHLPHPASAAYRGGK